MEAFERHGVDCTVIVEKSLAGQASKALGLPAGRIKKAVEDLGEAIDGPWRAEEKAAATAAWMVLKQ